MSDRSPTPPNSKGWPIPGTENMYGDPAYAKSPDDPRLQPPPPRPKPSLLAKIIVLGPLALVFWAGAIWVCAWILERMP